MIAPEGVTVTIEAATFVALTWNNPIRLGPDPAHSTETG